jgi:hypothetical protein
VSLETVCDCGRGGDGHCHRAAIRRDCSIADRGQSSCWSEFETSSAASTSVRIAEDRKYLLDDGAAQCVVSVADKGLGATMAWTAVKLAIQSEGRWVAAFSATSSSTRWGRNIESGRPRASKEGLRRACWDRRVC